MAAHYSRCIIKNGNTVWLRGSDGKLTDLDLFDDDLIAFAVRERLRIVRSWGEARALDGERRVAARRTSA